MADNAVYDSGVNHMYEVPQHAMRRDHPRGSAAYHSTADLEIHEYATQGPNEAVWMDGFVQYSSVECM